MIKLKNSVNCKYCGKIFYVTKSRYKNTNVKYCSRVCKGKDDFKFHKGNWISKKIKKENNCKCLNCKKEFYIKSSYIKKGRGKYCSKKCQFEHKTKINTLNCICENCGKIFKTTISIFISKRARHCSKKCSIENRKDEMVAFNKLKYSQVTLRCLNCKQKFLVIKGRYKTGNVKFCSLKCRVEYCVGDKSHTWKGGLTDKNIIERGRAKYSNWRKNIFKRDNFECQKCFDNNGHNLNVHHINNFSTNVKLRYDVNNGITLCKSCHKKFHLNYGYKNNNIEQLNKYLKNKNIKDKKNEK